MPSPAAPPDREIVASSYAAAMERVATRAHGHVLQVGSRASVLDLKAANWRQRLANMPFTGLDMEPGDNVDIVADVAGDFRVLRERLGTFQFGTIICAHVLEHVREPWIAARNMEKLLAAGGLLFIQVPWVQAYHPFPEDYWRFSFAGIKSLFPAIEFDEGFYSGGSSDRIYTVHSDQRTVTDRTAAAIEAKLFQVLLSAEENTRFLNDLGDRKLNLSRGYMPVAVINMIGIKK